MLLRRASFVLIALSTLTGLAHAQARGQRAPRAPEYVIRGKIVFDNPHPPDERIEVRLEQSGRQLIDVVFSDSIGNFRFRNFLPNTYYVVIEVEGYEPVRERVELSSSFRSNLTIFLNSKTVSRGTEKGGFEGDPKVVDINELRADYPDKAVEEYEKALKDAEKGNAGKAVDRLEKAVQLAPDFHQAQNNLGVQYKALGRYRDAERTFEIARDLNRNAAQPLINLGSMYVDEAQKQSSSGEEERALGTYQKAVASLEEAVALDAFSAQARYFLGTALYKTAALERAETMLMRALELDEEYHAVRLMLVNVYVKQARYNDVLAQLTEFLERNPDGPQSEAVRAMKQQIEKALQN